MDEVPKSKIKLCVSNLAFLVDPNRMETRRGKNGLIMVIYYVTNILSPPKIGMKWCLNYNNTYSDIVRGMRLHRLEVKYTLTIAVRHLRPKERYILKLSMGSLKVYKADRRIFRSSSCMYMLIKFQGRTILEPKLEWPIIHFDE